MGLAMLGKPRGPASQKYLGEFKRALGLGGGGRTGIGHTGTLDPFAEGGLCVGMGEGTKLLAPLTGLDKTYEATLLLGVQSETLDETGTLAGAPQTSLDRLEKLEVCEVIQHLDSMIGEFDQLPPQFSAVHVDGKRAYEWAREGIHKDIKPRRCRILGAEHISFERKSWRGFSVAEWRFKVQVSSGTYIRSFARDWGESLIGFPGLLSELKRTSVGPFASPENHGVQWLDLEQLKSLFEIIPITASEADQIRRFGRWTPRPMAAGRPGILVSPEGVAVAWIEPSGALGRVFLNDPLKPEMSIDSLRSFV